ncbi:MAG: 50S ribosomal protein L6 [bacterium]
MSRIGKQPVIIPAGVDVNIDGKVITVKGPKGQLTQVIHDHVLLKIVDNQVIVNIKDESDRSQGALWGLFARLIKNMVTGVTVGFEKKLEINGIGFKAAVNGKVLTLNVGFSHPVEFPFPDGTDIRVEGNAIIVSGNDKQVVGETAAKIRRIKKPEPYKGKGIKYADEQVRRKAGKAAGKGK